MKCAVKARPGRALFPPDPRDPGRTPAARRHGRTPRTAYGPLHGRHEAGAAPGQAGPGCLSLPRAASPCSYRRISFQITVTLTCLTGCGTGRRGQGPSRAWAPTRAACRARLPTTGSFGGRTRGAPRTVPRRARRRAARASPRSVAATPLHRRAGRRWCGGVHVATIKRRPADMQLCQVWRRGVRTRRGGGGSVRDIRSVGVAVSL